IYSAFVYSQGADNFNPLEIINNKYRLLEHVDLVIGFIYASSEVKNVTKRHQARGLYNAFFELAKAVNLKLPEQSFSCDKINQYVQACIDKYQALPVDCEKREYLNGWSVTSQSREPASVNLDFIYVKYSREYALKINETLKDYALTQKTTTLKRCLSDITGLLESVAMLDAYATVESFESLLNASHVHSTFYKAYQIQMSQCIAKGNDLYTFNREFISSIDAYESAFINTKVFPAPLKPFIKPDVKAIKNPPSFSTGGKASEAEKIIWFSDIPLHIKDEEVINIIEARLNRMMIFMREAFDNKFKKLKERQVRNKALRMEGLVKPLTGNVGRRGKGKVDFAIGIAYLANTIATFEHYGINGYTGAQYEQFLCFSGNTDTLLKELNLPTNETLLTLTSLLVMEHPKITPSWLQKLQLFDEHGKKIGYFQSGDQYILSSEKGRRGRTLAQQDVILNEYSKSIVDFIIEHTSIAREHLKAIGNPNWKFLLLTCSLNQAKKPSSKSQLYKTHQPLLNDFFESHNQTLGGDGLSSEEIELISSSLIHRAIRRHKGLQIYLETRSQSAVSEALGHKEMNTQILESYLPKPLMEFFTQRVIRQFQNAIIIKAMEGSPFLLDAVNMSYEEVKEFLENHGIKEVPDLNAKAFESAKSDAGQTIFDSIVFTITVPLIQLLISIQEFIKSNSEQDTVYFQNELVEHWYNCAAYLLSRFERGDFEDDDIEEMYYEAKSKPLNTNVIKGAISC
ncbi:hypothetical protein ACNO5E_24850, partial [Vibrio parahaemolyticus]